MKLIYYGASLNGPCFDQIFDAVAVLDGFGNDLPFDQTEDSINAENGFYFLVLRGIDNHDYSPAQFVLPIIIDHFRQNISRQTFAELIQTSFQKASDALNQSDKLKNYGVNIITAFIKNEKTQIAYLGDCVAYLQRNGITGLINLPHTLSAELYAAGYGYDHSLGFATLRSLGSLEIEKPDLLEITLKKHDFMILTTRFFGGSPVTPLYNPKIGKILGGLLQNQQPINSTKNQIIEEFAKDCGSTDDRTLIAVKCL